MSKQENIKTTGTVTQILPAGLFKVMLSNNVEIIAHLSGKIRQNNINVYLHDEVDIEMSTYDLTKGRITYRRRKQVDNPEVIPDKQKKRA